jgi:hypothetical protein
MVWGALGVTQGCLRGHFTALSGVDLRLHLLGQVAARLDSPNLLPIIIVWGLGGLRLEHY